MLVTKQSIIDINMYETKNIKAKQVRYKTTALFIKDILIKKTKQ